MVFSENGKEEQLVRAGCGKWRCAKIGHFLLHNFASQLESSQPSHFQHYPKASSTTLLQKSDRLHYQLNHFPGAKTVQSHVNDKSI